MVLLEIFVKYNHPFLQVDTYFGTNLNRNVETYYGMEGVLKVNGRGNNLIFIQDT